MAVAAKHSLYLKNVSSWSAVFGLPPCWENHCSPKTYNHVAFKIDEADFDDYLHRIKALGLEVKSGRQRVEGEARSMYFYDCDNHLFELHTGTLLERLIL